MSKFFIVVLLLSWSTVFAQENEINDFYENPTQFFTLGPKIYHVKRFKKGSQQKGALYGLTASYERIKGFSFYWGLEASYATGQIRGTSSRGNPLASNLTDVEFEGRLGYTFQLETRRVFIFIPLVGLGHFHQTNKFKLPSPLTIHSHDSFNYGMVGFFFDALITPYLHVGTLFKAKFMFEGKSKVSNDPRFPTSTSLIAERMQYSIEFPLTYQIWIWEKAFNASFVPFYDYRHFGGRRNYPFDFIDTKFFDIGAKLLCSYCF